MISALLQVGADIEGRDNVSEVVMRFLFYSFQRGWTPLHHACSKGHLQVVSLLLQHGGCIGARSNVRF
jgi:ankyrin repeat protein